MVTPLLLQGIALSLDAGSLTGAAVVGPAVLEMTG
jgi:hypothetical protein